MAFSKIWTDHITQTLLCLCTWNFLGKNLMCCLKTHIGCCPSRSPDNFSFSTHSVPHPWTCPFQGKHGIIMLFYRVHYYHGYWPISVWDAASFMTYGIKYIFIIITTITLWKKNLHIVYRMKRYANVTLTLWIWGSFWCSDVKNFKKKIVKAMLIVILLSLSLHFVICSKDLSASYLQVFVIFCVMMGY